MIVATARAQKPPLTRAFARGNQRWRWDLNSGPVPADLYGYVWVGVCGSGAEATFQPFRVGLSGPVRNGL